MLRILEPIKFDWSLYFISMFIYVKIFYGDLEKFFLYSYGHKERSI